MRSAVGVMGLVAALGVCVLGYALVAEECPCSMIDGTRCPNFLETTCANQPMAVCVTMVEKTNLKVPKWVGSQTGFYIAEDANQPCRREMNCVWVPAQGQVPAHCEADPKTKKFYDETESSVITDNCPLDPPA